MKVVILTTARGQRPSAVQVILSQLDLAGVDEVCVVSLHRPRRPIPVDHNLLVGPDFTLRRNAFELPTAPRSDVDDGDDEPALVAAPVRSRPAEPVYNPKRVARALSWRANRARLAVRNHPTVARVRGSTKVRKTKNLLAPGGLANRYAVACLRARNVNAAVAEADVVVALDANTYRSAWLLARRHPRPSVVVGTAAAKRVLGEKRSLANA